MIYPLTFYVKSLPPDVGGCANGPIIRILEKYRNDEGIYRHELLHVKQWAAFAILSLPLAYLLFHFGLFDWMGLSILPIAIHAALYRLVPAYRLWAEVSAYRVQAKYYPDDRSKLFAHFVAKYYDLKVTEAEVHALLKA
jgi:hypothetical protein